MASKHKIEFGIYLPQLQFGFEDIKTRVQHADRLGFHSVWFMDHLYPPQMPGIPSFEAWTIVSALATCTERVRLGHLVLANQFRHPAILAKMATSLDVISNGRLDLGIGTGSVPKEHAEFGIPFPPIKERSTRFEESLQIIKAMFTQEKTTFHGEYFHLDNVPNLPQPAQKPNPPLLVGGGGEKYLLPLAAKYADIWNCPTYSLGEMERKIAVLHEECKRAGRDPAAIRISEEAVLALAPSKKELDEVKAKALRRYPGPGWSLEAGGFVGTPEDIVRTVQAKAKLGVTLFVFFLSDRGDPKTLDLLAKEVLPAFR